MRSPGCARRAVQLPAAAQSELPRQVQQRSSQEPPIKRARNCESSVEIPSKYTLILYTNPPESPATVLPVRAWRQSGFTIYAKKPAPGCMPATWCPAASEMSGRHIPPAEAELEQPSLSHESGRDFFNRISDELEYSVRDDNKSF